VVEGLEVLPEPGIALIFVNAAPETLWDFFSLAFLIAVLWRRDAA